MVEQPAFRDSIVFTGGGTGGHFFPALALAEGARMRWPGKPMVFVGATRGIESRRLPESAWPYLLLDVEGFLGRSPVAMLRATWKLGVARSRLLKAWKRERPAAVIATGGYGSAPAVMAAKSLGIPYFLHESNAEPGMVVKRFARGAARVWCGMDAVMDRLPGGPCRQVGTPVRKAFLRAFKPAEALSAPFQLLVLGGSGGARALNTVLMEIAPGLLERFPRWRLLHQTGDRDHADLVSRPRHAHHLLQPFLEDMDQVMEASSLVVGRSGASTCAELKASGRPAILVPMPGSAGDHQTMNARAMVEEGRAIQVAQNEHLAQSLLQEMARLMENPALCLKLARPEPNQALDICLDDLAGTIRM